MMYFVSGDLVRQIEPPFQTGTVVKIEGETAWVDLDNEGSRAAFPSDKLELFDAGPAIPTDPPAASADDCGSRDETDALGMDGVVG